MTESKISRRELIKRVAVGTSTLALSKNGFVSGEITLYENNQLQINPAPKFDLSPYLYMQFMEPLGTTDSSVAAAWDFKKDCWREDVVDVTKKLAPALIRWGGIFCSYYRWKEAVGPRNLREATLNLLWGGIENNQVGTGEFVDFCRQVGADSLICVNFESDGKKVWSYSPKDGIRSADADEAREWVDYCNNPENKLRISHDVKQPYNVPIWQIGNETSYGGDGFDCETAARKTVEFVRAMRSADPNIKIIGWGDSGWAKRMIEVAGEYINYVAFHHMFNPDSGAKDSPLSGIEYRKDPARTWEHLMNAYKPHEEKILKMREETSGSNMSLAMTECHFALPGRNRGEVLSTWAAGVANARMLNVHERNGDVLKIATLADFCGTRWQVNAIMIPVPGGQSYMMPVALVMSLYRKHSGEKALGITSSPDNLDVTASRTGNKLFLHVVNINRTESIKSQIAISGMKIKSGKVFEIAADSMFEIFDSTWKDISVQEKRLPENAEWTFPSASVSAVELEIENL